jgi:putative transposase
MARPKRLDGISYVGFNTYFITACVLDRRKAFVAHDFCDPCRDELFALSDSHGFSTDAYVFMPDHAHLLVEGQRDTSNLDAFVSRWKQSTGFAWRRRAVTRLWQKG